MTAMDIKSVDPASVAHLKVSDSLPAYAAIDNTSVSAYNI